jgi:hypothetical protein
VTTAFFALIWLALSLWSPIAGALPWPSYFVIGVPAVLAGLGISWIDGKFVRRPWGSVVLLVGGVLVPEAFFWRYYPFGASAWVTLFLAGLTVGFDLFSRPHPRT